MSGTGKSTVIGELGALGYRAIDLDTDEWSAWVPLDRTSDLPNSAGPASPWRERDWVWREDRVQRLLTEEDTDVLFLSGTSPNQGQFHPHFDHIILLSAPASVLAGRLSTRTNNSYGKDPAELARVLEHVRTVEPLLQRAATAEVDTSVPLKRVLEAILRIVRS
jgi:shikimate kinase